VVCGGRLEITRPTKRVNPFRRGVRYWGGTLIHPTDGIPGYPALDFGAGRGTPVVAVESGRIRENSSAQDGGAFYMRAASGVDYWYRHITPTVTRGQSVRIGQVVGRIAAHHKADHLHLGANANFGAGLVGKGRAGTDRESDPAWRLGVSIMREINRAPRVG
jgi:murein DD-endopeptidase MepM/ murein hydrolase activator NlpD